MRYLFLIMFLINYTYAIDCKTSTKAEINNCTLSDVFYVLVPRLMPDGFELIDKDSTDDILNPYERIKPPKPTIQEFRDELSKWKLEQIDDLNFKARIEANLPNLRLKMGFCGYAVPNMKIFLKDIYRNKDTAKLDCLESKATQAENFVISQQTKDDEIKKAKEVINSFDCSSLTGINRAICTVMKR